MSLESTERAICAALNAANEKVGESAEMLVRDLMSLGANSGIFQVRVEGFKYSVQVARSCEGTNCYAPLSEHSPECLEEAAAARGWKIGGEA